MFPSFKDLVTSASVHAKQLFATMSQHLKESAINFCQYFFENKMPTKNSSVSFSSDTRQEINVGMKEKNLIVGLIKLNEDDWMFEKDVKMRNQHEIFKF